MMALAAHNPHRLVGTLPRKQCPSFDCDYGSRVPGSAPNACGWSVINLLRLGDDIPLHSCTVG